MNTPTLSFATPDSAEPAWLTAARDALEHAPDPNAARRLADNALAATTPEIRADLVGCPEDAIAAVFQALCGVAPFFASALVRNPSWLPALAAEDYSKPRPPATLLADLDAALETVRSRDPSQSDAAIRVLREFKYYELARITVRDCWPTWLPLPESAETLSELSLLADALLDGALAIAVAAISAQLGPAKWASVEASDPDIELGFCVLGLGKLGSRELNYSSDVDLVYVFEDPAAPVFQPEFDPEFDREPDSDSQRGSTVTPVEYFTRLGQKFGAIVTETTAHGFLYRIDLDLRPEGGQGGLVISDNALATYYEAWADTWEKAAFIKARPVAGDLDLGWRTVRAVDPMIFRSSMDYAAVESIRTLKAKVEAAHGHNDSGFNVKIDSGGIRDIEFIAQSMQLLHGGRILQVRDPSTQGALERLAGAEVLPRAEVDGLLDAYRFLRRLENRLQMEAERQTHVLGTKPAQRRRIAHAMGYRGPNSAEEFDVELGVQRAKVVFFFESFLGGGEDEKIFELFARNVPRLVALESSRRLILQLSSHFAREIGASPDPERALNNLDRFIQAVGRRQFYYDLMVDRPELVTRLVTLFAASKFLSDVIASHPTLIEPLFSDPAVLIPSREAMFADLQALVGAGIDAGGDDTEARLDSLRLFKHRQVLNAGLLELDEKIDRVALETALTTIAEVCTETALDFARHALSKRSATAPAEGSATFLIVAMGKLASRELSYGSDLDLVFVFDVLEDDAMRLVEAQEYFVRLAQRFISVLQTSTREGSCYDIDARLRPSGNQGMLVSSLASFEHYHDTSAQIWERQALLRARPVVGDAALAEAFQSLRIGILSRELPPDLGDEIHRIRVRIEAELARETHAHRNFKTGRGGVFDVECAVQYLQLRHGREHPELFDWRRTEEHLDRLAELGAMTQDDHRVLCDGWEFLQRLGNRLRVMENRSISDLDEERGDMEGLARRLGYRSSGRERGAYRELLRDYDRHTTLVREAYLRILGVEG